MNIENRLFEKIGDTAGRLHTARLRNDQVALDMRLFARESTLQVIKTLQKFNIQLIDMAETNIRVVMPGYTHLQHAQPVLFSHYIMAYFHMFSRDIQRFEDCLKRTNSCRWAAARWPACPIRWTAVRGAEAGVRLGERQQHGLCFRP